MGKPAPKTSALIVSAIRKLREVQGSTPRQIMDFIVSEYNVSGPNVQRKLQAALKRGLECGILRFQKGHYSLSTDATGGGGGTFSTVGEDEGQVEKCGKRRRKYRKCKKTRRCGRGCVPNRRKEKCGKKRRRSRRSRCPKRCGNIPDENLALGPSDCRKRNDINAKRSRHSCRSTRSRSEHSSTICARDTSMDRGEN